MTKNIAASDLFEQNLFTRFLLENELELSPAYLNGSKKADSDPNRYKNDLLSDLFVERVLQDPYFSIHICQKIDESQVDLKKAIAYIQHIILEQYIHRGNSPQDVEKNTIKDWFQKSDDLNELKYNKLYSQILYSDNEDLKYVIDSIPTKKRKLLTRWQDRSPFSWCGTYNPDDTRLRNNSQANDYFNHQLNVTNKKYFIDFLKHIDFKDESRFLHENIIPHFRSSFNSDKRSLKSSYLAFLNFNTEILVEIKDTLFKYGFMHENDENDIAAYLKFYLDAVLLCQYSWFNSFNEKTKIDMLNSYYDEFELSIKKQNLSLFGNYSLLHELAYNEAKKLYGEKDYVNSLSLLNKLITSSDDPYFNYSCVSLIADIYQEINEYDNALEYFLQAYEISKRFDETTIESENIDTSLIYGERFNRRYRKSNFSYRYNLGIIQYIELLNIAEMNCYPGNRDKANEYLELLEREIQDFSIPKQIIILGYLAQFCTNNQETLRFAFLNETIELCDRFKPGMISEIEDDIKDNIFSMLGYGENISREECAQDWISSREKYARKIIEQSGNTTSSSKIRSDLIKVYSDYYYSIKNNSTPLTSIIENSGIRSINDVYCGFASTIEPHRLAKTFKSTIEKLENTEGIEDQECYYGPYNEIIEKLKFGMARCHYTAGDFQNAEDIFRHLINNSKDPEILFNSYCLLGIILIKLQNEESGIHMLEKAVDLDFHDFDIFYCIRDELSISSDFLLKVSQAIIDRVNQKTQNEDDCEKNGYLLAVKEFNEHDLTNEASHFIEKGLKFQDDQLLKMYLLEEKAYIYYLDHDFKNAKEILEDILNEIMILKANNNTISSKYDNFCASA